MGYLGTLMGRHKVNIASMSLSRDTVGGYALTALNLDSVPPQELPDEIKKIRHQYCQRGGTVRKITGTVFRWLV